MVAEQLRDNPNILVYGLIFLNHATMKHPLPPLDGLKAFEASARHLSFSLAADELCITKGAISYQIRKLESHLNCALFRRSTRQIYLTDAGQILLQTTQQLFAELTDALDRLQGDTEQSGISVAVTTYVAARWLSSHISTFNDRHPDVAVLLQHSVNSADFKLTEVDLAIRWGPCNGRSDPNRLAEMPMPLFPAISAVLLQKHGLTGEYAAGEKLNSQKIGEGALAALPLLSEDRPHDLWQEWYDSAISKPAAVRHGGTREATPQHTRPPLPNTSRPPNHPRPPTPSPLPNPARTIADSNVRVQAAIDGQGWILADQLMINELNSGQLVAPFEETLDGYGYALLCSPNRLLNDNSQALKSWLLVQAGASG